MDSETKVEVAEIKVILDDIQEDITFIKKALLGNGKEGLIISVDRNTRCIKNLMWALSVVFIAVVTAIVKVFIC